MKKKITKKITVKKQKSMARTAKRKALSEWSQSIRKRDISCVVCGKTEKLQAHHICPKRFYQQYMYDINIGITLCPKCHQFSPQCAEYNAIWFSEWLKEHRKEQWEYCKRIVQK